MSIPGTRRLGHATLPQALLAVARRAPEAAFLRVVEGEGPPRAVTWGAFERGVRRAAAFLQRAGVGRGDRLLFLAENSPGWQQVALGAQALRAEPAALFAHLAAEPAQALALRVRPRVAFLSGAAQWEKLAPVAGALAGAGLTAVLCGEPLPPASVPAGLRVHLTAEVLEAPEAPELSPAAFDALARAGDGEDPFLVVFTSGTTGRPKGVRVPQRAMLRALEGGWVSTGRTAADEGVHFLPFGHIAGHDHFMLALVQGHRLLMAARREDIPRALALGPTYLFSVPLVYERMRDEVRVKLAASPRPVRALARAALDAAARVVSGQGRGLADRLLAALARRLVGGPLRARLGGRVEGLFAGGAASPPGLALFFESLGIPYVELYGMSETAGLISSNLFAGPRRPGSAGHPSSDLELRLLDDGELCVRGGTLMTGYLDPEDEAGAFTADGFFRTGDLAALEADGTLTVVGRKKSLLVLSTGKKLSPEPIEAALAAVPPLAGAVLAGDGHPFVAAAVFVPRPELARLEALGDEPAGRLLEQMRGALSHLSEYERPKRLVVIPGAPSDYPDLLTPSLKLKRDAVLRLVEEDLERLYAPAAPRQPSRGPE